MTTQEYEECPYCGIMCTCYENNDWDEYDEYNDSPTGHGDICWSDADPGL